MTCESVNPFEVRLHQKALPQGKLAVGGPNPALIKGRCKAKAAIGAGSSGAGRSLGEEYSGAGI